MITFSSAVRCGRPIRLCEGTRQAAKDSLAGKYGNQTKQVRCVSVDNVENFQSLSDYDKYDIMIKEIAKRAPIPMMEGELLCASASMYAAVCHEVPAYFGGKAVMGSVSHLTCNLDKVLDCGIDYYKDEIEHYINTSTEENAEKLRFRKSLLNVYESIVIWHKRWMDALDEYKNNAKSTEQVQYYQDLINNLEEMPFKKPVTFRQALQSLWFTFSFIRLCGNWTGIGRIDEMLEPFVQADLKKGIITIDEARELLAHFWIKGCEWITLDAAYGGDAQHYQNIVLGGIDSEGKSVVGNVTRLVLEIVEELPISDFPIAVRINDSDPQWLRDKIASVIRHGSGVVAVYNETLIINSLCEFGYSLEEARKFANDGCWEVQIPGKTRFGYSPLNALDILQVRTLKLDEKGNKNVDFDSYEKLYEEFLLQLEIFMDEWQSSADKLCDDKTSASVVAFFEEGCALNGKDYFNAGPVYNVLSPHLGGVPDIANSLFAIKKMVFDEKMITFDELISMLKQNWEGNESMQLHAKNAYEYYGNDNDEVDLILADIMEHFMDYTRKVKERNGIKRPAGISTFGRQIEWKDTHFATAHGFKNGDILAGNLSPTPSTDKKGPTAVIKSHCKVNFSKLTCGTALDIKLDPSTVEGSEGVDAICALLSGFADLGGFFMQIDVLDPAVLEQAQKNPELYQNLAVRLSGWSARFVTLDTNWQRMVIERAKGVQ